MTHQTAKEHYIIINMIALSKTKERIVDKLIKNLEAYKDSGFKKDTRPICETLTLTMKWEQENGNATLTTILENADKFDSISAITNRVFNDLN